MISTDTHTRFCCFVSSGHTERLEQLTHRTRLSIYPDELNNKSEKYMKLKKKKHDTNGKYNSLINSSTSIYKLPVLSFKCILFGVTILLKILYKSL